PGFRPKGGGLDAVRFLLLCQRKRECLVHACDTYVVPPLQVDPREPSGASRTTTIADRQAFVTSYSGVPSEASPPKTAKGLLGVASQTSSPPGSTSPWRLRASFSASSRVAVPAITYDQRRTTPYPSASRRRARSFA